MKLNMQSGFVPKRKKVRIEMLPLIDIVFLLLVFFIYAMLSMAVHRGLQVVLPVSSTSEIDTELVLSVTVKKDGSIFLDKDKTTIANLRTKLQNRIKLRDDVADGSSPRVLLFADQSLAYQELFKVLDQIKMAGITNISLQADGAL
jgi:biopolymer transport protein ExbD